MYKLLLLVLNFIKRKSDKLAFIGYNWCKQQADKTVFETNFLSGKEMSNRRRSTKVILHAPAK